jgi:hypothetical protein
MGDRHQMSASMATSAISRQANTECETAAINRSHTNERNTRQKVSLKRRMPDGGHLRAP